MKTATRDLGRPALAAITFSPRGGGIAAVSRLVRQALEDAGTLSCFALATGDRDFRTSRVRQARFGLEIATAQMTSRCDWVFYTHLHLAAVQRVVPRGVARPYVVFLHDVEAWTTLTGGARRVLAGAALRLANSRFTAERVAAANPSCGPVIACPLAIPPPVPTVDGDIDIGVKSVVIVGRMTGSDAYKGHDQLLEAWPDVMRMVPGATLWCVGEGDDVGRLRDKAASHGVAGAVHFPGFVDDAMRARIYDRAAVLAMPSRREGFGLVYVEAMAAGLPCIGSIHDAARDVIVDGETGFLVDQADRGSLVDRIVRLLGDDDLRRRMGASGRSRYERLFTFDAFRTRLHDALTEALPATIGPGARRAEPGVV